MPQLDMPTRLRTHLETAMLRTCIDDRFTVGRLLGSGNTAVTYEVTDESGLPWALKLVLRESYGERAPFREVSRFAAARDRRFLVFPQEVGDCTIQLRAREYEFIWFKSECIRGTTLQSFLQSDEHFAANVEIARFIENIVVGLEQLAELGFCHGDLHDRNILRTIIGADGPLPELRYVIIDFSEAHERENTLGGLQNDMQCLGQHLRAFADVVRRRPTLTSDDERVLSAVDHIPGLLNGAAPETIGLSSASGVLARFNDGLTSTANAASTLVHPFQSLSAENIANDGLLAKLCFTDMWWWPKLQEHDNLLLIGPRGSGKTMTFRRLRLKTKIGAGKTQEVTDDDYVAFYLPCESLFYTRFSDLSDIDIVAYTPALVAFFNMAVLAEVSSALAIIPSALLADPQRVVRALLALARSEIGPVWDTLHLPAVLTTLDELEDLAAAVMRHIRIEIAYGRDLPLRGSTDFVAELVSAVKESVGALSNRHFIFLLDDYTEERVPLRLQDALHPIVCQRSPHASFKISAHMFGSIYSQPSPDEGRNIEVINLGSAYLQRNRRTKEKRLLIKILNERLRNCESGYGGKIEDWLGKTAFPGGMTLSQAIRAKKSAYYHGVQCLMDLCTGDYSDMIRLVREIFQEARVDANTQAKQIEPRLQNQAIARVSKEFLGRIRHIRPDGDKLFDILVNFGALSKGLLLERTLVSQGRDGRGQPRHDPCDLLTIYVDDLTKAPTSARRVWERLQKASVFVDEGVAPSIRSQVADTVTLRRIYCPALGTTLSSSERLQLTRSQFELLMDKPKEACKLLLDARVRTARQPTLDLDEPTPASVSEADAPDVEPMYYPEQKSMADLRAAAPPQWRARVQELPGLSPLNTTLQPGEHFDLYVGALGFEDRTTAAVLSLTEMAAQVTEALLLEFDIHVDENERHRGEYENALRVLTGGRPHRPVNSPIGEPHPSFSQKFRSRLDSLQMEGIPDVLFDCTSCPSVVLSQVIAVLLDYPCRLTVLYSEAEDYYPTRETWESGELKREGTQVEIPFSGVRFMAKPPILQSPDTEERPVLQVLFPTFSRERTENVIADIDPAKRIWVFGEPHDMPKNGYRIDMAKWYAAHVMSPGDPWTLVSTFDFRDALLALGGTYATHRSLHRIVVMPHGSKMQTLGVGLFRTAHEVSLVFAMPKTYDPSRYSKGCIQVWGLSLGRTDELVASLREARVLGLGAGKG